MIKLVVKYQVRVRISYYIIRQVIYLSFRLVIIVIENLFLTNAGLRFEIKLNNNQMWILYSDSDITFTIDSSEKALKATGNT